MESLLRFTHAGHNLPCLHARRPLNIQNTPITAPATALDYFLHTKWKKTGLVTVCASPFSLPWLFLHGLTKPLLPHPTSEEASLGEGCNSEEASHLDIQATPLPWLLGASVHPSCSLLPSSHTTHTSLLTQPSARLALIFGFSFPTTVTFHRPLAISQLLLPSQGTVPSF